MAIRISDHKAGAVTELINVIRNHGARSKINLIREQILRRLVRPTRRGTAPDSSPTAARRAETARDFLTFFHQPLSKRFVRGKAGKESHVFFDRLLDGLILALLDDSRSRRKFSAVLATFHFDSHLNS